MQTTDGPPTSSATTTPALRVRPTVPVSTRTPAPGTVAPVVPSRRGTPPMRAVGTIIAVMGLAVLAGHVADIATLVRPLAAFPPQSVIGGLNTVLIGVALADPQIAGRRLGRGAALLLVATSATALLLLAQGSGLLARAPISPLGATVGLLGGIGLAILRRRGPRLGGTSIVLACAITLLLGSAIVFVLDSAAWVFGTGLQAAPVVRVPVQVLVNGLLTGGALLYAVLATPARAVSRIPLWLAVGAGALTVAWSVSVWRSVARAQERQLRELVHAQGDAVAAKVAVAFAEEPTLAATARYGTAGAWATAARRVLPDVKEGYTGAVVLRGERPLVIGAAVPDVADERAYGVTVPVSGTGLPLDVRLWPTTALVRATRTNLPELILLLGVLVAGLLASTLRLAAESQRVARREERAALLLAMASADRAMSYEWDLETDNVLREPAVARSLGLEPEALGMHAAGWRDRIHPDDRDEVQEGLRAHLAGRSDEYVARYRVRAADGTWHTIIDRGRIAERDAEGRARRVVGVCANLDAMHPAPSPFALGTLAQAMLAPNGHVITHTRAALRFLAPAPGGRGQRLVPAAPADGVALDALLAAAGERGAARGALQLRDVDGAVRDVELAATALREAAGRRGDEVLVELWDVTERRAADAAQAEADRLMTLGRLAARVAHEINNPLAGIRTAFQLVKRGLPDGHTAWPFAQAIEREIARIAAVTRQLYETYRPDQSPPTAAIGTVVGDCVALLGEAAKERGVHVEAATDGAPSTVPVPEAALRQALYNLVQNAIEASPAGTTVRVLVGAEGERLRIRVRDQGPGIPPEHRARVFDEGYTTKQGRPGTGGLGLGLALVHHSVTALGGTVSVHEGPEGGAEFRLDLPLAAPTHHGVLLA